MTLLYLTKLLNIYYISGGLDKLELIELDETNMLSPDYETKYRIVTVKKIKKITSIIRASFEYKSYIYFLKNTLNLDRCAFFEGYDLNVGSIEIHHAPFTLYQYCVTVANKHLKEKDYFKSMEVAEEVCLLHYNFKVGLVPLNPTAHELADSDKLPIHPDLVLGDWESFYIEYKEFHSDEIKKCYNDAKSLINSQDYTEFPAILKRNEIKFNIQNQIGVDKFDISKMLKDMSVQRMKQLEDKIDTKYVTG